MATDTLTSDISTIVSDLEVYKDSPLTLSLPYFASSYDSKHDRMASGGNYFKSNFRYLFDALILPKYPNVLFWHESLQKRELEPGQTAYRLEPQRTSPDNKNRNACWSIQKLTGGSDVINEYRLRKTYGNLLGDVVGILEGVPTWKMQLHVHQETPTDQRDTVPFEDAVLFSMLLDLVTGTFEPHTKTMEDGPALQLEIFQMLEKAHKDSVEAENVASGKRKPSMQERLDGKKKVKTG